MPGRPIQLMADGDRANASSIDVNNVEPRRFTCRDASQPPGARFEQSVNRH